ncbi:hypothetical protein IMSHALPRED_000289 [Imshaugia aleurites]|uniref:TauD/TfdA-like domain-containing protein n=1 Tax=Imshaugia aleurites TaxID=172621 RepID=A0A8H3EY11_9LECA|nr:hypothetical protein IMSHALPRED_000289 [Imshaugia aleurites]
MQPGTDQVKRIRWHSNLTGSLLSPYDEYKGARLAHQKFQEILRRNTHQLKMMLKPGDLYIWDNFRLLHRREKLLEVPRTGVGQTVPEHVVHDRYRALSTKRLGGLVDEKWLFHMPMPQLRDLVHNRMPLDSEPALRLSGDSEPREEPKRYLTRTETRSHCWV